MASVEKDTKIVFKDEEELKEPKDYIVVLLNDNYTSKDFVVEILIAIFHKKADDAYDIMHTVHNTGRGAVGVYTWDIAQTKVSQVHAVAKQYNYPLKCIVEDA